MEIIIIFLITLFVRKWDKYCLMYQIFLTNPAPHDENHDSLHSLPILSQHSFSFFTMVSQFPPFSSQSLQAFLFLPLLFSTNPSLFTLFSTAHFICRSSPSTDRLFVDWCHHSYLPNAVDEVTIDVPSPLSRSVVSVDRCRDF